MRITPISAGMVYRTPAQRQEVNSKNVRNCTEIPSFYGLWGDKKPTLSDKFRYGLEALDDNSMLIVTSDDKVSNFMLNKALENIDIPIIKTYTLKVGEGDLINRNKLEANFGIFKKNNDYYVINLSEWIYRLEVRNPDESLNANRHFIKSGETKKLTQGEFIGTGELYSYIHDKHKFMFNPPYSYNPANAERYLEVKSAVSTAEGLQKFNRQTISALTAGEKRVTKRKEFTFQDIGGLGNVIENLRKSIIRPINYPMVYQNIRLNKGIMLYGPPRCGKTLLGKAIANEANAEFRYVNANEFKSSEVGGSEKSVRNIFQTAEDKAPYILFIDEFDAIGKKRDGSSNARFDDSVVNQFLGCMSDLEKSNAMAFVIAATNRLDLIDPALLASGRFGLHLEVPMPDLEGLKEIYDIHSKGQPIGNDVSRDELAQIMLDNKFNGSDVAEMVTLGYYNALERLGINEKMDNKTFMLSDLEKIKIAKEDFLQAISKLAKQKL